MQANKLSSGQLKVAATGFLSLFSIVGIMVYGLPFFYDFWVKDYGWSRATVTSGNVFAQGAVWLFGFFVGLFLVFFCSMCVFFFVFFFFFFEKKNLFFEEILMGAIALVGLSTVTTLWQF